MEDVAKSDIDTGLKLNIKVAMSFVYMCRQLKWYDYLIYFVLLKKMSRHLQGKNRLLAHRILPIVTSIRYVPVLRTAFQFIYSIYRENMNTLASAYKS